MVTLAGMLGLMMLAVIIGKKTNVIHPSSYIIIVFIVLAQVLLVLYAMYTMSDPNS